MARQRIRVVVADQPPAPKKSKKDPATAVATIATAVAGVARGVAQVARAIAWWKK